MNCFRFMDKTSATSLFQHDPSNFSEYYATLVRHLYTYYIILGESKQDMFAGRKIVLYWHQTFQSLQLDEYYVAPAVF